MTAHHILILSAFIFLFSIQPTTLAEEETFSISKSLNFWNEEPFVAVNSNTGDILVVWGRMDLENRDNAKIYAVLCKLNNDGSFKFGKLRLISGKNDTCTQPSAAYDAESNTYFVTWRIDRNTASDKLGADIQGRVLNAKGKTFGGIIEVLKTTDRREYYSVIAVVPQTTREAVNGAAYLISWELNPTDTADYATLAGLWTMLLDAKGTSVAHPNRIMKMAFKTGPFDSGDAYPYRILPTDNVPFYMSMVNVRFSGGERVQDTYIVKLDKKGAYTGKVLLDSGQSPMNTSIAMVSKKKLLASWYNFDEYRCRNQLLKSTLKKKKGISSPFSHDSATSEIVGLADGGAFQIITTYPDIHIAHFNSKGKMLGDCKQHALPYTFSGDFAAAEILGTGKILMVWRRAAGSYTTEIVGTVLETK